MLCLPHSICYDDPSLQRLLRAVEDAPTLTTLLLAAWQVARVLPVQFVEAVLTVRARQLTAWLPCVRESAAQLGLCLASAHEPVWPDPLASARWTVPAGVCHPAGGTVGCGTGGAAASVEQRGGAGPGLCLGRVRTLCHGGALAGLVLWRCGPCARRMGGGANRWPPCLGAALGGTRHGGSGTRATARAAGGGACRLALGSGG
jgi:hypothetical protein